MLDQQTPETRFRAAMADNDIRAARDVLGTLTLGELTTEEGIFALGIAARYGNLTVLEQLLQIDAVRDAAAADENDVLKGAVVAGQLAVVNRLLDIDAV